MSIPHMNTDAMGPPNIPVILEVISNIEVPTSIIRKARPIVNTPKETARKGTRFVTAHNYLEKAVLRCCVIALKCVLHGIAYVRLL